MKQAFILYIILLVKRNYLYFIVFLYKGAFGILYSPR